MKTSLISLFALLCVSTAACSTQATTEEATTSADSLSSPGALTGRYVLNDPNVVTWVLRYTIQESETGHAVVVVKADNQPQFEARAELQEISPGVYGGSGVQVFDRNNGCREKFWVTYTKDFTPRSRNINVALHGSDGACGTPRDIVMSHTIAGA